MPELLEVEAYRRAAARLAGRTVLGVDLPDGRYLRGVEPEVLRASVTGRSVVGVRRHGKLLIVDLGGPDARGPSLGLHFGMTGRLLVDGDAAIDGLRYGPAGNRAAWVRFGLRTAPAGGLEVIDPRRLGSVRLDPDPADLGPDAATLSTAQLSAALDSGRPLKAVLLDQGAVAGLGNLLVDESLWRARIRPDRVARALDPSERRRLARTIRSTVSDLGRRGGSDTGDLQEPRDARGTCPRCGAPLSRATVAGRTTFWCPAEQV
ncbi:MAG: formamidopyrimidine-DNA glycosylase [Acidobacteria bacterium]|nr:formamidopyrimidine-DNA glycosylase [Acidobacteriota bacterium]